MAKNRKPNPPSELQLNGVADTGEEMISGIHTGSAFVSAKITDPNNLQQVRILIHVSTRSDMGGYVQHVSSWIKEGRRVGMTIGGLSNNTLYYVRVYTQDRKYVWSEQYAALKFWTNRFPTAPDISVPPDNITMPSTDGLHVGWYARDPDHGDGVAPQAGYGIRWRTLGTPVVPPGPWNLAEIPTTSQNHDFAPSVFPAGSRIEFQVRTYDPQGSWGAYSVLRTVNVEGITTPPTPLSPIGGAAAVVDRQLDLRWRFNDPAPGATQGSATVRYRAVGSPTWVTLGVSGAVTALSLEAGTLQSGYQYEWQVQTTRAEGQDPTSDWSAVARFWTIVTPGSAVQPIPDAIEVRGELGVGEYRFYIFDRGGIIQRGQLQSVSTYAWHRRRDAISTAEITLQGLSDDDVQLLRKVNCWINELVIYRGNDRVWEGPITRIQETRGQVQLGAHDVFVYPYRRIMRQGYNDSGRLVAPDVVVGPRTVVERAGMVLVNSLAYHDPNLIAHLTMLTSGTDSRQARVVPDYYSNAWQELDDMARQAGLDYTAFCRRMILWDTHTPVGVLTELRDGDFSEPVTVTDYGMQAANFYGVTDGQGVYGTAIPIGTDAATWHQGYGPLEMLATGYGQTTPAADATALSAEERQALVNTLTAQARRNLGSRWPVPRVVRVPDNSTLDPSVNITINQLIPGVWIPVSAEEVIRPLRQVQKLDSLTVSGNASEGNRTEAVAVTMSPAPRASEDPDAASEGEDAADGGIA